MTLFEIINRLCHPTRQTANRLFRRGCRLYDNNQFFDALKAWQEAAALGHPQSQYRLALCFVQGKGAFRSVPDAVAWYHRAAEQGHTQAQFDLGLIYLEGAPAPV